MSLLSLFLIVSSANSQTPSEIYAKAKQVLQSGTTSYASDYFSFAGADKIGKVLFALDTNRGRSGEEYQADHFVALWDENKGFVKVDGYGTYENSHKKLLEIADSPFFKFMGHSYGPIEITAQTMRLSLDIDAPKPQTYVTNPSTVFSMASSPATLRWGDRTIRGRVIYEYLVKDGFNRLAGGAGLKTLFRKMTFTGLYLAQPPGSDFYIHTSEGKMASEFGGELMYFWTDDLISRQLKDVKIETVEKCGAFGFYLWPCGWKIKAKVDDDLFEMNVTVIDHETEKNWIFGGFAMQAVRAELDYKGAKKTYFGFAELIK